jgi:hypothetical protein
MSKILKQEVAARLRERLSGFRTSGHPEVVPRQLSPGRQSAFQHWPGRAANAIGSDCRLSGNWPTRARPRGESTTSETRRLDDATRKFGGSATNCRPPNREVAPNTRSQSTDRLRTSRSPADGRGRRVVGHSSRRGRFRKCGICDACRVTGTVAS